MTVSNMLVYLFFVSAHCYECKARASELEHPNDVGLLGTHKDVAFHFIEFSDDDVWLILCRWCFVNIILTTVVCGHVRKISLALCEVT